jgi:hypothetical protein
MFSLARRAFTPSHNRVQSISSTSKASLIPFKSLFRPLLFDILCLDTSAFGIGLWEGQSYSEPLMTMLGVKPIGEEAIGAKVGEVEVGFLGDGGLGLNTIRRGFKSILSMGGL